MKKLILIYFSACLILSVAVSCNKNVSPEGTTSFTIINTLPGCPYMSTNFSGQYAIKWYWSAKMIGYGNFQPGYHLSIPVKAQPLALYNYPDTTEKDKPLYTLTLNPNPGDITTLFLSGTLAQPEHLLVTKKPPVYKLTDSLVGLRLINLSAGSSPLRVKITGSGVDLSTNNLGYQGFTDYLMLPADSKIGNLLVQFFDQVTGDLLTTYTLSEVGATLTDNKWRYKNYTLAFYGLPNSTNPSYVQKTLLIDDY